MRDGAGLLEDEDGDIYGFPHRTFRVLAAMHLARQLISQNLVELAEARPRPLAGGGVGGQQCCPSPLFVGTIEARAYCASRYPRPTEREQTLGGFLAGQLLVG